MDSPFVILDSKDKIDNVIAFTNNKLVILRFGETGNDETMKLDNILSKCINLVSKMANIYTIELESVPEYTHYFNIEFSPSVLFFFNTEVMKVDYGTADHSKFVGSFFNKEDFIDLVIAIFDGAMKGKHIVDCPIPKTRIPHYNLLYKDI